MIGTFKKSALAAAIVLAIGATVFLVTVEGEKKPATVHGKPTLTVTTAKPQSEELAVKLVVNGNVAAWQETIISAEVYGLRLITVGANVGDVIKRGEVLASFASETLEAELAQQKASVAEAEAAFTEAQENAERARTLKVTGALSAQQINQYMTAEKISVARLAAARAVANGAQIRLRNTHVLAPDSGVVSARNATVGGVVEAGQELFRMIRNNRLEWRAEVSAADLGKVRIGQSTTLTTPSGASVTGKVRMIAPTIDPQTRNTLVYVDLSNGSDARAGMFVKGEFELGNSAALTVPQQAVVVRDGFSYVFTIKQAREKESSALRRVVQLKVSTGRRDTDRLEIVDGLNADELIVAGGAGFLNDGDLVAIASSVTASPTKHTQNPRSVQSSEQIILNAPEKNDLIR